MNKQVTFYIIRHAETEANKNRIMQGNIDSPLTDKGLRKAKNAAKLLGKIPVDTIISSDSKRAFDTAVIIAIPHHIEVIRSSELRERLMGSIDGKSKDIFENELKEEFSKYKLMSRNNRFEYELAGMESDKKVAQRLVNYIKKIFTKSKYKTIFIITHGGVMKSFLQYVGFATYDELPTGSISYCGYIKTTYDGVTFSVKETNGIRITKP